MATMGLSSTAEATRCEFGIVRRLFGATHRGDSLFHSWTRGREWVSRGFVIVNIWRTRSGLVETICVDIESHRCWIGFLALPSGGSPRPKTDVALHRCKYSTRNGGWLHAS